MQKWETWNYGIPLLKKRISWVRLIASARAGAEKIFSKARTRTHMQVLGKLTDIVDEKYLLREDCTFHSTDNTFGKWQTHPGRYSLISRNLFQFPG